MPRYAPRAFEIARTAGYVEADGRVLVVGYNDMAGILRELAARFSQAHPEVRFRFDLRGTRFAPEALAQGRSAFAPMGALFTPPQLEAYRAATGHEPLAFRIAHASLEPRALSGPLAVFVHRSNPLESLTLAQVEGIFTGRLVRWGELGLQGDWATREIHAVGLQEGTALAYEMQAIAMAGRALGSRVQGLPQSAEVVARVAGNPQGVGFAAAMRGTPAVRVVPIGRGDGVAAVAPTPETIRAGRYPLDRYLYIHAAAPLSALAREFLRLALSREGQEAIAASDLGYLPLSEDDAAAERSRLR